MTKERPRHDSPPGYGPPPGHGYPPPHYYPPYPYPYPYPYPPPYAYGPPQSTLGGKGGLIAGILLIIGGIIALIAGGAITAVGLFLSAAPFIGYLGGIYAGCGIFMLIAGIMGILGATFAMKREKWAFVLVACVLLIIGYSFIFGILSLIFLILSKDEFIS